MAAHRDRRPSCRLRADPFRPPPFDEASRHIYASHAPIWDRRWRLILVVGDLEPKARDAIRRALFWQGFGAWVTSASCTPVPTSPLPSMRWSPKASATSRPPDAAARRRFPLRLSANDGDLVRRAWDLQELAQAYAGFVSTTCPSSPNCAVTVLSRSMRKMPFLVRLLLIHDYRRLLLRDPELPDVLLPATGPARRRVCCCAWISTVACPAAERHRRR